MENRSELIIFQFRFSQFIVHHGADPGFHIRFIDDAVAGNSQ